MHVYITGAASFFPNLPVPAQQIERILGQVEGALSPRKKDFLRRISGIQSRYYAIDPATGKVTHSNAQLTAAAIQELLERTGTESSGIDLLACGTSSPDQLIPSHASMVHGILRWPPCEIVSTAGVCCSVMTAMKYALNGLLAGNSKRAVVTGSELASPVLTAKQFEFVNSEQSVEEEVSLGREFLRFMLSDGASAILLEPDPGHRLAKKKTAHCAAGEWKIEALSTPRETGASSCIRILSSSMKISLNSV
jgi:3-oxoacyl-[acyl-carrier-protein] synthase-3